MLQDGSGSKRYDDGSCKNEKQCALCSFKFYPKARLRGICSNNFIDSFYTMEFDDDTNMPYFKGESGTYITYEEENMRWLLKNDPDTGIIGTAPAKLDSLGTGANLWNFNKDICYRNSLEPFNAILTTCKVV